jgi:UDP-glucuronate decarboxylase
VDDMVEGLVRLMETPDEVTGPINLGNPQEITIAELAGLVIELTGSRSELVRQPLPSDDPRRRRPDIGLAERTLAWTPTTALREGLTQTIGYFEKTLSAGA